AANCLRPVARRPISASASLLSQFTFAATPPPVFLASEVAGPPGSQKSLVGQIEQNAVRIGKRLLAKLAVLEIFLASLTISANSDFSRARCRSGASEDVEIFFSLLQVVDFETKVIQSGHQAAVSIHVPRS